MRHKELKMKLFKKHVCTDLVPYLQEMVSTKGLMSYFMGSLQISLFKNIYHLESEKYELRLAAVQYTAFEHKCYFTVQIFFKSGETYTIETCNAIPKKSTDIHWDTKIRFKKGVVGGSNTYEDIVKSVSEKIIKEQIPEMISSMKAIIKGYQIEQNSKEDAFRNEYE